MRYPRTLGALAFAAVLSLVTPASADPGDLDPSFGGGDGMVTNDFGSSEQGGGVLVLPSGKIVQVGSTAIGGASDMAIARYKPGGARDLTFGGDGRVTTDFFNGNDSATAVARYGNGKIIVAGTAQNAAGTDFHFALTRYLQTGALDTTFGGDGRVITPFPNEGFAVDILVMNDGSIVAVGEDLDEVNFTSDFAVAKYQPNGMPDSSFSDDGKLTTDFAGGADRATDVLRQENRLLVTGRGEDGPSADGDVALARYLSNGNLDSTFSGGGKKLIPLTSGGDVGAEMIRLNNGRIVIGAQADDVDVALVRTGPNGGLDGTFGGGDGIVIEDFGGGEFPNGLVRVGERLLLGGSATPEQEQAVWRFTLNGAVTPGFGTDGEALSDFPTSAGGSAIARFDGRVVVSGQTSEDLALSRFLLS